MLKRTFVHIQGIGPKTETKLWKRGIKSWEHFLNARGPLFSPERDAFIRKEVERSLSHCHDIAFFSTRLASADRWRLYGAFKHGAIYMDIETSGGYHGMDEITVIGIYDGKEVKTFINGVNLQDFEDAIHGYQMVITFNGGSFDLPYIRRHFPEIQLPPVHIDLFPLLGRLGFKGGLKSIERQLGILRAPAIAHMDGYDAVKLWAAYEWGDKSALERLVRYNTADIVNLEPLMEFAYGKMKTKLLGQFDQCHGHEKARR